MIDSIQELKPKLSRRQASQLLSRQVIPKNAEKGLIKGNLVKAQPTTTDRTAITVSQQYRWHRLVDSVYKDLWERNTGVCPVTSRSFGELMPHFLIGLDESSICADHAGNLKIIGAANKKKHEKILQDSRLSITMVRTGTVAGTTGPTIILLKGVTKQKAYSDDFLVKHGLAPGSTIIMTESAYMTNEAWLKATPYLMKGYRQLPYIKDNPNWFIVEFLDGFVSHESVFEANKLRAEKKCLSVKEEAATSHSNQAYDQLVAKNDKHIACDTLTLQRTMLKLNGLNRKQLTQYHLVHTVLQVVTATTQDMWVQSFVRVNLDPRVRLPFQEWIVKIQTYLAAGQTIINEE